MSPSLLSISLDNVTRTISHFVCETMIFKYRSPCLLHFTLSTLPFPDFIYICWWCGGSRLDGSGTTKREVTWWLSSMMAQIWVFLTSKIPITFKDLIFSHSLSLLFNFKISSSFIDDAVGLDVVAPIPRKWRWIGGWDRWGAYLGLVRWFGFWQR